MLNNYQAWREVVDATTTCTREMHKINQTETHKHHPRRYERITLGRVTLKPEPNDTWNETDTHAIYIFYQTFFKDTYAYIRNICSSSSFNTDALLLLQSGSVVLIMYY